MTLPEYLASLKALSEKATKGPWLLFARGKTISISLEGKFGKTPCVVNWPGFDGCDLPLSKQRANAAFIAAAREAVPWLIEIVEAQASVLKALYAMGVSGRTTQLDTLHKAESALAALLKEVMI